MNKGNCALKLVDEIILIEYFWNKTVLIKPSLTEICKGAFVFKDFRNVERGRFPEYLGQIKYSLFRSEFRLDS